MYLNRRPVLIGYRHTMKFKNIFVYYLTAKIKILVKVSCYFKAN